MLALRRRGRYGVLYVDGDADFYQPEVNPLRGRHRRAISPLRPDAGRNIVCDLEGRRPLVRDGDVAVLGCRDETSREAAAASRCPATCWSWTATTSAGSAPLALAARR